ncbi:hypothetical protein PUN28_006586 [Cardiocondyla obscurior]
MYQLFKAIKYIHSGNVIHRDLKPSNVLLNAQCHCKIADFGLARSVTQIGEGDGETGSDPTLTDYVATRWYRAPEILIASKRYTKGIDMWSLGCILGEMLLEKPLFPGSSTINQVERIMATLPPPTDEDLMSVSAGYGTNLLEKTPNRPRRTLKDLLPEITEKALDLISNLIVFNPTQRLTAVEALEHPYVADFHRRGNEPERGSSVIPLLSDDVQLSVDEYRNKLYAMMDEKHRKHKNISKSRLRQLSESLRKETSKNNLVIGQGDTIVACSSLSNKKVIRPFHDDSILHGITRTQTVNNSVEVSVQETFTNTRHNVRNVATQYSCNLTNGNIPPTTTKSCFYFNQQRQSQLSKSQRSIQSDQMAMYGGGRSSQLAATAQRTKPRKVYRQQIFTQASRPFTSVSANCRGDDRRPKTMPAKLIKINDSPSNIRPTSVTKSVVRTTGGKANSPESPRVNYHPQVVRNYLNQTVSLSTQQRPRAQSRTFCRDRDNLVSRSFVDTVMTNNCGKNAARDQGRLNARYTFDVDGIGQKKLPTTYDKLRFLNSHSQSHGVITESVYKDLFNGTVEW